MSRFSRVSGGATPKLHITLHEGADARTLALTRIYLWGLWFVLIAFDDFPSLGYLDPQLWYAQGAMKLLPNGFPYWMASPDLLWFVKLLMLGLIMLAMLGPRQGRMWNAAACTGLAFYFGYLKGFGGHVNHREMILIYVCFVMSFLPAWDVWAMSQRPIDGGDSDEESEDAYAHGMVLLCLTVITSYVFVGLARLTIGFPEVFYPQTMFAWVVDRGVRPNLLASELGIFVLQVPVLKSLLGIAMPAATLLELFATVVLFTRRRWLRYGVVISLLLMHLGIYSLMNILFLENMLLLPVLLISWKKEKQAGSLPSN